MRPEGFVANRPATAAEGGSKGVVVGTSAGERGRSHWPNAGIEAMAATQTPANPMIATAMASILLKRGFGIDSTVPLR